MPPPPPPPRIQNMGGTEGTVLFEPSCMHFFPTVSVSIYGQMKSSLVPNWYPLSTPEYCACVFCCTAQVFAPLQAFRSRSSAMSKSGLLGSYIDGKHTWNSYSSDPETSTLVQLYWLTVINMVSYRTLIALFVANLLRFAVVSSTGDPILLGEP